jgi:hypothetical protein
VFEGGLRAALAGRHDWSEAGAAAVVALATDYGAFLLSPVPVVPPSVQMHRRLNDDLIRIDTIQKCISEPVSCDSGPCIAKNVFC